MFKVNETWVINRGDMHLQIEKEGLIDPYFLMDAASCYLFGVVFAIKEKPKMETPYNPEYEKLKNKATRDIAPDSYDLCPCASGKKFKFCCKPAYQEIVMAMAKAQEHNYEAALDYMKKAEAILGKSAEVLCRYAVIYSFFDTKKFQDYLKECLKKYPHHPRANYLKGISLKEDGDLDGAIQSYQRALQNYPKTDKYHLNETLNNLGSIYFDLGQHFEAKAAWEKALMYIPYDRLVRKNLKEFIYDNPDLPEHLRQMSSFIKRIFESTHSLEI